MKQLDGPDHTGIGFAIGMERLVTIMDTGTGKDVPAPVFFLVGLGERAGKKTMIWVNELRRSGIWVEMDYGSKGLKAQMKRADRLGAKMTLIVGDNELTSGKGILRDMKTKEQKEVDLDSLVETLKEKV